jgi:hypothetical protein
MNELATQPQGRGVHKGSISTQKYKLRLIGLKYHSDLWVSIEKKETPVGRLFKDKRLSTFHEGFQVFLFSAAMSTAPRDLTIRGS